MELASQNWERHIRGHARWAFGADRGSARIVLVNSPVKPLLVRRIDHPRIPPDEVLSWSSQAQTFSGRSGQVLRAATTTRHASRPRPSTGSRKPTRSRSPRATRQAGVPRPRSDRRQGGRWPGLPLQPPRSAGPANNQTPLESRRPAAISRSVRGPVPAHRPRQSAFRLFASSRFVP